MSTARPAEMSRIRRFAVPALCVLAAGGYAAVFLAHHDVAMAIAGAAIMLAYGAVLVVFSRRSEVAALLRDTANDERHALINLRACALALYAVVTVAVVMTFVNLARNGNPGTWGTVCAILGAAYIAGIVLFSRRG
jgi:hypothetical protein